MNQPVHLPTDKHEHLIELARTLNKDISLDALLQQLVDSACQLTGSQVASILLIENDTGLLKFVAGPPDQIGKLRRLRVPIERSVAGEVFLKGGAVIVNQAERDQRVFSTVDRLLSFQTRSILAVPVSYRDQSIGVMEAVNKADKTGYTEQDVSVLSTLADYAANAVFNTLLFEEGQDWQRDQSNLEVKKSDFIAIAAHELRTPLGNILGHVAFLQEEIQDTEYQGHLEGIMKAAMRLKEIFEDLAVLDTAEAGAARVVSRQVALHKLIPQVCGFFEQDAKEKHIRLRHDIPQGDLRIEGDEEKIVIVLENLLRNALTFTDNGGLVQLKAEKLPGYVKVSVVDSGIGIPTKDLPYVFERFYQVEEHGTRRHGGLGLGLSVAKVMVELHGGDIWVESVDGRGSNFSFMLPEREVG